MMKKISLIGILIVMLLAVVSTVSAYDVRDTMEEGQTKTYIGDGKSYEIEILIITDYPSATFKINGENVGTLYEGIGYVLREKGITIKIIDIMIDEAELGSGDTVEFGLTGSSVQCTDSDNGMDFYTKGVGKGIYAGARAGYHFIYGTEPNPTTPKQTSNSYTTYYDHCANANQLNEAFCDSNGKLQAYGYQCPNGCSNGVCLTAPTTPTCTDSDGGANFYVKGKTGVPGNMREDYCRDSGTVIEMTCATNYVGWRGDYHDCEHGCRDGACLTSAIPTPTCTDSDGRNYDVRGYVEAYENSVDQSKDKHYDYCGVAGNEAGKLVEYICGSDNYVTKELVPCQNGCSYGACLSAPASNVVGCTDSDGGKNYYQKGTVVDPKFTQGLNDFCKNDRELYEYYCSYFTNFGDGTPDGYYGTSRLYTCPNGCRNGACIGTAPAVKGDFVIKEITFNPRNPKPGQKVQITANIYNSGITKSVQIHFMVNGNIIGPLAFAEFHLDEGSNSMYKDYTFESDSEVTVIVDPYDYVTETNEGNNKMMEKLRVGSGTCTDSDGGRNSFKKGTAYGVLSPLGTLNQGKTGYATDFCLQLKDGQFPWIYDFRWNSDNVIANTNLYGNCEKDCAVYEMYCTENGQVTGDLINCQNGCRNGACVTEESQPDICSDTDGGLNAYVRGTVVGWEVEGITDKWTDYCGVAGEEKGLLVEYTCRSDGFGIKNLYKCPFGCANGICVSQDATKKDDLIYYPKMYEVTAEFHGTIVVGDSAPASNVIAATDISQSLNQEMVVRIDATKLASEVDDPMYYTISVGNACDNAVTAKLLGYPDNCLKGLENGVGVIQLFNYNGYPQIVVSGYTEDDVRKAAKVLTNWKQYNLKGKKVLVYGTLANPRIKTVVEEEAIEVVEEEESPEYQGTLVLVEYGDYSCPYSSKFSTEVLPKIRKEYITPGKINFVFRNMPLDFHPNAKHAAHATLCANEQGKYWEMHNILFENYKEQSESDLMNYAKKIGLSVEKYNDCMGSGRHYREIESQMEEGKELGVQGTPTFFINGERIDGAHPYENFKKIIEKHLKGYHVPERETTPTCTDGIWNDGEEGVDCGGPCKPCRFAEADCNGCVKDSVCLPFGTRVVNENRVPQFCNIDKKFADQKEYNGACQNNYECESNQCSNGKCISLEKELRETRNLMEKIANWLSKWFR